MKRSILNSASIVIQAELRKLVQEKPRLAVFNAMPVWIVKKDLPQTLALRK